MVSSKPPRRILALWFPCLPTDRLQREGRKHSQPESPPLVVVEKIDNALRVMAADNAATALGVFVGQPLANARAMLPDLDVAAADRAADLRTLTHLADWCDRFTPLVALDPPDGLLLDVTGAAHLFAGEQAMLAAVCQGLRKLEFATEGAIAGTVRAARALARYAPGQVVLPGGDAQAISPLPVAALALDPVATHAFRRAGLKTVGQVASRKRAEIVARFGAHMIAILDEALGHATRPLSPRLPQPVYTQEQNFPEPVALTDTVLGVLENLAAALGKILTRHGEGARRLEATFFRADGKVRRLAIDMSAPTRDSAIIIRLFREKLSALADPLDPGFGFDLIRLSVIRAEPVKAEIRDLQKGADGESEIGFLADRLAVRFGRDRLLVFEPQESHVPEAAWRAAPAQRGEKSNLPWRMIRASGDAPRRPLRVFAGPEPVILQHSPPDAPHLQWRKVTRALIAWEGPERIAMEWWRMGSPQVPRDYYRAEDIEGRRYWLYCAGEPPKWFLHGLFA